jgi:hypothetical protein
MMDTFEAEKEKIHGELEAKLKQEIGELKQQYVT